MNDERGEKAAPPEDLRNRLRKYSLRIIRFCASLPRNRAAYLLGDQLFRSGTSAGAHHREAHRARSNAEFISKMEGGLGELDESLYWIELLILSDIHNVQEARDLISETDELIRIFVASIKRAKSND